MSLTLRTGQCSDKGRKPCNQDFHGLCVPAQPQLATKGIAIALADGISSSDVSHLAAQAAVRSFLDDYYCTSDAWSVKTSVERVLVAANSWLHAQNQRGPGRYDKDRGWVCTLSAMVLKSRTAHLFHVGDTRIYQLHGKALEQLTQDHRVQVGAGQSYLARALGVHGHLEIDHHTVALAEGDTFVLATDGVYEHVPPAAIVAAIERHGDALDRAAREIVDEGLSRGSPDNLTVQIVRVERLPDPQASELARLATELPLPPMLEPRAVFDGYRIVRELHGSSRSHIYLATDESSGEAVVLKTPSIDLHGDRAYLERFLLEEWVARRISSPHVLKPRAGVRARSFLYVVFEYVEGRTLAQWMLDHPRADIAAVRPLVEQIARGMRAFHRLEMLHQDLRPENIMVDATGTVKIIDFGAARVAGVVEMAPERDVHPLGTVTYSAPECLLGQPGTARSDQFSLAVITYQMLTGQLPYGTEVAKCKSLAEHRRLKYRTARQAQPRLPSWVDDAIEKALQPEPHKRYGDVDEFVASLHRPDPDFARSGRLPLIERNPLVFWKSLSALLALGCVLLLALLHAGG
ncbi:bifunctional protein-serine/threonine kinase/phosphatase [Schlegelella sp. S2-27]|uniref:Bifunctional protein-serine/threonine kinase/phosphatase n=1 Tax=Caldimonas mangrovi TaxID=2944811 RepID=A0ABT0YPL3_9BURK|nr:bifunctional protein-serine/threonine kinase/phosphatase [Caldimonas mangrovi]MCM5680608.1 bifunctional protein-serine/threonine kinase/phosphatase [Caldimonas mangrovi]